MAARLMYMEATGFLDRGPPLPHPYAAPPRREGPGGTAFGTHYPSHYPPRVDSVSSAAGGGGRGLGPGALGGDDYQEVEKSNIIMLVRGREGGGMGCNGGLGRNGGDGSTCQSW
jgi:hypothetical protein